MTRWETTGAPAFINPACCASTSNAVFCPALFAIVFLSLHLASVVYAILANSGISAAKELFADESGGSSSVGFWELIFVIFCVLALTGFSFYWGFSSPNVGSALDSSDAKCRPYGLGDHMIPARRPGFPYAERNNTGLYVKYADARFTPVDLNSVYGSAVPPSSYLQGAIRNVNAYEPNTVATNSSLIYTSNPIMTLAAEHMGFKNFGLRIGILAVNGRIESKPASKNSGPSSSRPFFFDYAGSYDDYQLVYGSIRELNEYLS